MVPTSCFVQESLQFEQLEDGPSAWFLLLLRLLLLELIVNNGKNEKERPTPAFCAAPTNSGAKDVGDAGPAGSLAAGAGVM